MSKYLWLRIWLQWFWQVVYEFVSTVLNLPLGKDSYEDLRKVFPKWYIHTYTYLWFYGTRRVRGRRFSLPQILHGCQICTSGVLCKEEPGLPVKRDAHKWILPTFKPMFLKKKKILPSRICLKWRLPGPIPSNQFIKEGLITCISTNFHGKSEPVQPDHTLKGAWKDPPFSVAPGVSTKMLCKG